MTDSAVRITAPADQYRGAVPERAFATQEPRQRHEAVARQVYEAELEKKREESRKTEATKPKSIFRMQIRSCAAPIA